MASGARGPLPRKVSVMPIQPPGVYVGETPPAPPPAPQAPTTVAAFIGHTERALDGATSLAGVPRRVRSMVEFERLFGGPPRPCFRLADPVAAGAADRSGRSDLPVVLVDDPGPPARQRALVHAGPVYMLHAALRHFFTNGGGPAWVVSAGTYDAAFDVGRFLSALGALDAEEEPTLLIIPEAAALPRDDARGLHRAALAQCAQRRDRFAFLDIRAGFRDRDDPQGDPVRAFRADLGSDGSAFGAAYYPWLRTTLFSERDFNPDQLLPDNHALPGQSPQGSGLSEGRILQAMADLSNLLPPGAAMAGLYTVSDQSRGVWAAPANLTVRAVHAPAVAINSTAQADLNSPARGAPVNAIRHLPGRGVLVWGARTLDASGPEWRYVPVRRTAIMIETTLSRAARALASQPNTLPTWRLLRAQAEAFLGGLWRQGGLAGARPEEAYALRIGPGETMTQADIDAGHMILAISIAPTRPAEFLTFTVTQVMHRP